MAAAGKRDLAAIEKTGIFFKFDITAGLND
jgi:hypothetical protein